MKIRLLTLFAAFALLLSGCGTVGPAAQATPTPYPTPVKATFTVKRGDISVEARLNGRVTPLALQTVYFQMNGQVAQVFANANDVVKKGQLLGELAEAQELRAKADQTQRTIRRAQIALEIAQLTLQQYKEQGRPATDIKIQELNVELAQMDLDEVLEGLGVSPDAPLTDELDAQVAQARAYAPADGTIISAVNVGRNVTPTTPAFVLGDPHQLEVTADLDTNSDDQVKQFFEGMPVSVNFESNGGAKVAGTIRQLPSPYGTGASDERVVHITLQEAPSAGTYQLGDTATVIVPLASKQGALWLPPDAIRSVSGRTFVIVNSASGPKRVDIQIGLQTRDMVEIVSGLAEGQVVVGP